MEQGSKQTIVTPDRLRIAASQCEVNGDWETAEVLNKAADMLVSLQAQNQAYRHALSTGVSINLVAKKRWLRKD